MAANNQLPKLSWKQEKKEEIWLSPMTKAPTPAKIQKATWQHKKTSITQQLRTDLGRSAGVTADTPLVWLNRALNLPTNRNSRVIKRTYI